MGTTCTKHSGSIEDVKLIKRAEPYIIKSNKNGFLYYKINCINVEYNRINNNKKNFKFPREIINIIDNIQNGILFKIRTGITYWDLHISIFKIFEKILIIFNNNKKLNFLRNPEYNKNFSTSAPWMYTGSSSSEDNFGYKLITISKRVLEVTFTITLERNQGVNNNKHIIEIFHYNKNVKPILIKKKIEINHALNNLSKKNNLQSTVNVAHRPDDNKTPSETFNINELLKPVYVGGKKKKKVK